VALAPGSKLPVSFATGIVKQPVRLVKWSVAKVLRSIAIIA